MNLGRGRLSVRGGVLLGFLLVLLTPPSAYAQQAPSGASPSGSGAQAPPTGPTPQPLPGAPRPEGKPSEEAPTAPPEFQPPPPTAQFPLLPPVQLGPATPETPLKPIPLGLAPPFQLEGRRFALQLSLGVQEEFSDNINQTNTNRQSGWSTSITPGISLGINSPLTTLSLGYFPSFFFSNNDIQDNTVNQYLALQGTWQASPLIRLNLIDGLTYSNQFLAFGDIGTLRTGTNPTLTNTGSVGIAYTPTWGNLGIAYTNTINRIYDVQSPDDSLIQSGGISAGFNFGPRFSVGASYTVTRGVYEISSDYWDQTVGINAGYTVTPTLNAQLLGSFTFHEPDSPISIEYFSGNAGIGGNWRYSPTGRVSLIAGVSVYSPQVESFPNPALIPSLSSVSTTQIGPSFIFGWSQEFQYVSIAAQYTHVYQPDLGTIDFFNLSFMRTAGLTFGTTGALFRNLTATLGVNWVQNEYPLTTVNVRAGTTQNTVNVNFAVGYNIIRGVLLSFSYNFTTRDSTTPSEDFYENRFQMGLTYAYNVF